MKVAGFPWSFRNNKVFDPRQVNENFRKSAQYIKDTLALRYTYSMMSFDLSGVDTTQPSNTRRFMFFPPAPMEIIGAELVTSNLDAKDKLHVKWLSGTDFPAGTLVANAAAVPALTPVILPAGGPTESWRYVEVEAIGGQVVNSNTQQRNLRIGDPVPLGVYCLEVGSDTGVILNGGPSGKTATINIWLRSSRGTNPEFNMPEMFNGQDAADATKFLSIAADLEVQRAAALSNANQNTFRLDAFCVRDLSTTLGIEQAISTARIPAPSSGSGEGALRLARVDFHVVADGGQFSNAGSGRILTTEVTDGAPIMTQTLDLDGPAATYEEIFRAGDTLAAPQISGLGKDALNPADDFKFNISDNLPATSNSIKALWVYLWYRLTT